MKLFVKEKITDKGLLKALKKMDTQIKAVGGRLTFNIKIENDGWTAKCKEFDGIMTGGINKNPSQEEVMKSLINATKTAFHIPISKLKIQKDELQKFPEFPKIRVVREFQMV